MKNNALHAGNRRLGKGEVASSILSGSTIKVQHYQHLADQPPPCPPLAERERIANSEPRLGENSGTLFDGCSYTVSDGVGVIGTIVRRGERYTAISVAAGYIGVFTSTRHAMRAIGWAHGARMVSS